MVIEKKEQPNFYGKLCPNLQISAAFTAILKISLLQCNAIRVRLVSTRGKSAAIMVNLTNVGLLVFRRRMLKKFSFAVTCFHSLESSLN